MKNKRAFTLIELIVVVAVIAILALLAMPRFMGRAREATISRAQHDAKVVENKNDEYSIMSGDAIEELKEVTLSSLKRIVEEENLVEREGVVTNLSESTSYYHIPESFIKNNYSIRKSTHDVAYLSKEGDVYMDISGRPPEYMSSGEGDTEYANDGYFEINDAGVIINFFPDGENRSLPLLFEVNIPPTIDGIEVVEIDGGAMRGGQMHGMPNHRITKVTIPDTVKIIRQNAFSNNPLTEIIIGDSVEIIEENAFYFDSLDSEEVQASVGKLTIPSCVKEIQFSAFRNLGIEELVFESGGEDATLIIGNQAFTENKLKQVHLPAYVEEIERMAFYDNEIETVTMEEGIVSIGQDAFTQNNLKGTLTIPDTVTYLSNSAFDNMGIKELVIGSGIIDWRPKGNPIEKLVIRGDVLSNPSGFSGSGPQGDMYIQDIDNSWGFSGDYRKGTYQYNSINGRFDYSPDLP